MNRIFLISIFLTILPSLLQASGAPSIPAHLPPNLDNDESALLATARAVEPELLKNGYRKYELVSARVAAWTKDQQVEPKDLKANLFLPAEEDHKGPYPLLVYVHGGEFLFKHSLYIFKFNLPSLGALYVLAESSSVILPPNKNLPQNESHLSYFYFFDDPAVSIASKRRPQHSSPPASKS
ncbi:MAG: hypothetical protein ACLFS1_11540 [Opitutales bacterium]